METERGDQSRWPVGVIVVSSIPIVLMLLGILAEVVDAATISLRPYTGVEDTTLESLLFFGGQFFALPCGVINLVVGSIAWQRGLVTRRAYRVVNALGWLGLVMGGLAWGFIMMMAQFTF